MVPFGEIVANPSDLKHVGELMGRSNGLGVVITFGLHHLCVFFKRFPNGAKWYETEVGNTIATYGIVAGALADMR